MRRSVSPDALTRDFAGVPDLRLDPNTPIRVFRPTAGAKAELRPTLRPAAEQPTAAVEATWHVGPQRADAVGTVHWSGKDAPALVEFALSGVKVLEVRDATAEELEHGHIHGKGGATSRRFEFSVSDPVKMLLQLEDASLVQPQPLPHRITALHRGVKRADACLIAMDETTVDIDEQVAVLRVECLLHG